MAIHNKKVLYAEFDVTKMARKYKTADTAAADGYGSAEAGHLPIGVYGPTNGPCILPDGALVTEVWIICSDTFDDDSGGSAATLALGLDATNTTSGTDEDEYVAATNAGSAPWTAGTTTSVIAGRSAAVYGSNAANVDTAAELSAVVGAICVRQTASQDVVLTLAADEITAGVAHVYIEYIQTAVQS